MPCWHPGHGDEYAAFSCSGGLWNPERWFHPDQPHRRLSPAHPEPTNQTATPQLADVQCENCHGPAANHAASELDSTVRPRVELAATVCGGCHTGPQHPIYEEWATSDHATVTPTVAAHERQYQFHHSLRPVPFGLGVPEPPEKTSACRWATRKSKSAVPFAMILTRSMASPMSTGWSLSPVLLSGRGFVFTNNQVGGLHTHQVDLLLLTNDYASVSICKTSRAAHISRP